MKNYLSFKFLTLFLTLIISVSSFAQQVDMKLLHGLTPRNIGPAGMSGRVTSIDAVTSNPDIIFIGTASGGLWKSTSGGLKWEALFTDKDYASIGAVKINQKNPDIIWVGTGEGNPRNSQSSGNGIYKSIDGGRTWTHMGLRDSRNIHRIILHPKNENIIYVGVQGAAWGAGAERGVFKTTDGGITWNKVLYVKDRTGIGDLIIDPVNPNKLFAAMWEFDRSAWFFTSGGEGSGLYMTYDGGENWTKLTTKEGMPAGKLGRIGLGISPANPEVVYALIESKKNALYRSDDGGHKWKKVADKNIGGRPFYYGEIHVDPTNENRVYNLYTVVDMSEDGGKTFKNLIPWTKVHPDHHAWYSHPEDGSFLIDGNDGGLAISRDRGKTWRFIRNLPLAQYYHINYDMEKPYNVYGGMQDNGSWRGPSMVHNVGGIQNAYWKELSFGDGFDVVPDRSDKRYGYSMSQQGNVVRYDLVTGYNKFIQPTHPEGERLRFNWNAAIAANPFDDKSIYFGSQYVHISYDRGDSWEIISPDLTTNDPEKQKAHLSGGDLTYDGSGAENHTTILAIEPSSLNKDIIWVGTDDGNLQLTLDGGKTWNNMIDRIKDVPKGSWIPQIVSSQYNEGEAFVVINDYRRDNWTPYVYHTKDYGKKWKSIVSSEQVTGYTLSFAQDPVAKDLYFLGTESGLYFSIDAGKNWTKWTYKYPTVSTMDLKIHPRENDLIIGTFGRAAFIIDNIQPLRELAENKLELFDKSAHLFPVPEAEMAFTAQPPGMRFPADGEFIGENKRTGAMISFIANPKEGSKEKAIFKIYDKDGKYMKTIKNNPKKGINRIYWYFDKVGVRMPNQPKPKMPGREPRGGMVLPGEYKIVLSYNGEKDSTMIKVEVDHRIEYDMENLLARQALADDFVNDVKRATDAADKTRGAKAIARQVNGLLKTQKGEEFKELKEMQKNIDKGIKEILDELSRTKTQGFSGIDRYKMFYAIQMGYYATMRGIHAPGQAEKLALSKAKETVDEFVAMVDKFFEEQWNPYQEKVQESNLNFFSNF